MQIDFTKEELQWMLECLKWTMHPVEPEEYEVEVVLKIQTALREAEGTNGIH